MIAMPRGRRWDLLGQALMLALGEEIGPHDTPPPAPVDEDPEKKLLNGPQLPGAGVSQDDIDKLFG